jgi:hypothetical protein
MKILFLLLMLCSQTTLAQVQVHLVDPHLDASPLEGKGYHITREHTEFSALPDKEVRDQFLLEVPEVKGWDELERDIFYMNLKDRTLEQLMKKYPSFSKERLKKLKVKRG